MKTLTVKDYDENESSSKGPLIIQRNTEEETTFLH